MIGDFKKDVKAQILCLLIKIDVNGEYLKDFPFLSLAMART
jgi:hypothetical protein